MKLNLSLVCCALLCGCASFSTTQTDTRKENQDGSSETTITTKASTRTLFDSKSNLANFKATQTEKSQSASVGSLSQESSGTNIVNLFEAIARGAVQGAKP